jgi:hypothetical protein
MTRSIRAKLECRLPDSQWGYGCPALHGILESPVRPLFKVETGLTHHSGRMFIICFPCIRIIFTLEEEIIM